MIYRLNDQIDLALSTAYDPETGELLEGLTEDELFAEMERMRVDFDTKIDSLTSAYKNLVAEANAIKNEKQALADRQKIAENKAERLKRLLAYLLNGEKWKNGRHVISYRKSEELVLDDDFIEWAKDYAPDLLKYREPEPKKADIRTAIRNGNTFDHAHLESRNNIQIKIAKEKEKENESDS